MRNHSVIRLAWSFAVPALLLWAPAPAHAHCDGMDGPVVKAAQRALESGDMNPALVWVRKQDEAEITRAFEKTLAVRKLSPEARELADRYFFETLVRIHRSGEGAPYTGLKPAGRDLGPAIPEADKALESGQIEPLSGLLRGAMERGMKEQFHEVMAKKRFGPDDVEGGRKFVEADVTFIHYVERLYEAAEHGAAGHYPE